MSTETPKVESKAETPKKQTPPKKQKSVKIGDAVKFFDEQNREFKGKVEKVNGTKASIRVSRLRGHSQVYLGVPQSLNKLTKPRFN